MLLPPFRMYRCYICVEHRQVAPLQEMNLLKEHLAKHLDFHLFECRGCHLKFATPFIANFHIKEGKCKKEEGELSDDGGPPLHEVGIDTKSFEEFSQLENAVTKCTELMLYELNYGEDDLLNCLVFSKQPAMCPVSPDPITRRERQIQTSPPTVGARPPSRPARTVTPDAQALPGRPVTPLAQPSTASTSQDTSEDIDAIDGYSLVSDDELQPSKLQRSPNIDVDDGLSFISEITSTTVEDESPRQTPLNCSSTPSIQPSHSPSNASSVPSLMSLRLNEIFDQDPPPRTDRRQQVIMPERGYIPPSAVHVEADSSSSSATGPPRIPFFFQATPASTSRSAPNMVPPSYEPVYPAAPVYSADMRMNNDRPQQLFPYRLRQNLSSTAETQPMSHPRDSLPFCGPFCHSNAEVSSTTMHALPQHQGRQPSSMSVYPTYEERLRTSEQVSKHHSLPGFTVGDDRCSGQGEYLVPRDDDNQFLDGQPIESPGNGGSFQQSNDMMQPSSSNSEWVGCPVSHPTDPRISLEAEMNCRYDSHSQESRIHMETRTVWKPDGTSEKVLLSFRPKKPRRSFGITVSVDPHTLASTLLEERRRKRSGNGRRSDAMPSKVKRRNRAQTIGARSNPSRRRSQGVRARRRETSSCSISGRSYSTERRGRHSNNALETYDSLLHGENMSRRKDRSTGSYRSRSRRRRSDHSEDDRLEESRKRPRKSEVNDEGGDSPGQCTSNDVVVKTEPMSPEPQDDHEMLEVIERLKTRANRAQHTSDRSRFSKWKRKYGSFFGPFEHLVHPQYFRQSMREQFSPQRHQKQKK